MAWTVAIVLFASSQIVATLAGMIVARNRGFATWLGIASAGLGIGALFVVGG